ncbi:MAG TPA: hypothetical protein VNU68_02025 [Verrucomicrobiae bacterium]|nr:hypothetical protein [Verrucomicrobiae bacterium]
MSHVTASKIVYKDLDALRSAVAAFPELTWCEGQKTWKYWGSWANDYHQEDAAYKRLGIDPKTYGTGVHAIKCKGTDWEIGVVARKDGGYALVFDFYGESGRRIQEVAGKEANKLAQLYSKYATINAAKKAGYMVTQKVTASGAIRMQLVKP